MGEGIAQGPKIAILVVVVISAVAGSMMLRRKRPAAPPGAPVADAPARAELPKETPDQFAVNTLRALGTSEQLYHDKNGAYTDSFEALEPFRNLPGYDGPPISARLAAAPAMGYAFVVRLGNDPKWQYVATAEPTLTTPPPSARP